MMTEARPTADPDTRSARTGHLGRKGTVTRRTPRRSCRTR